MAICTGYQGLKIYLQHGLKELYCDSTHHMNGPIFFWSYVFYLSKYYEFFDTLFIILKKKELQFLHVYHHSIIVVLCLWFLRENVLFFFSGVVINATIHTFMYYYYSIASLGKTVWWKKYLTTGQIIQFIWGISSWWPFPVFCTLTSEIWMVWGFNQFVLFSFLVLFVQFFKKTYKSKRN
jgi:fatty acid elongase 3